MPAATQPPIIDLTDIVEKKINAPQPAAEDILGGQVSDLMKKDAGGDDINLDDLLAQLNDGEQERAPSSAQAVNPNEQLNMPGMDDMDAMFREFGAGASPAAAKAKTAAADAELDDLLAELDKPAPPDAARDQADVELDDLLAGLDGAEHTPAEPVAPPSVDDELDALLDAAPVQTTPAQGKQGAPDDRARDPESGRAQSAAPPRDNQADEMLNNLLDGLDVPPSGPVERPVAPADADRDARHLDALLDSAPRQTGLQDEGEASAALETGLALELHSAVAQLRDRLEHTASDALQTREDQERLHQEVEQLRDRLEHAANDALQTREDREQSLQSAESARSAAADLLLRLEAVEEQYGGIAGELAAFREHLAALEDRLAGQAASLDPEQLNGIAEQVVSAMRPEIERAAAASAARVIREEISALCAVS